MLFPERTKSELNYFANIFIRLSNTQFSFLWQAGLHIQGVGRGDEGEYSCQVQTFAKSQTFTFCQALGGFIQFCILAPKKHWLCRTAMY